MQQCPFAVGDIVVFDCPRRKEVFIGRIEQAHIVKWGTKQIPKITPATLEQKQKWFDNGKDELVIESKGPGFMGAMFSIDDY